jgi:hypothetical protein
MAKGLIPYSGFSGEILKYFYSPNLIFKNSGDEFLNLYCFIAKVEAWSDELTPPSPENTDQYLKNVNKNLIALKKINTNDICPVIPRIDWKENSKYNQYSSTRNGTSGNYYVRNSYDQIFKCLSNGTSSTYPSGTVTQRQPIIDFTTNFVDSIIDTGDGYKWKYLFTIDSGSKLKFFDENWIPLPVTTHRPSIKSNLIGSGEVSVINVFNGGSGYSDDINASNQTTTVQIQGDGSGATARAIVSGNTITQILVNTNGSNYTYATANVMPTLGYAGSGAQLVAEISPIGGHGHDILSELGCKNLMVTAEFNGTETGTLPSDIDYRQIGLIANPEIVVGSSVQFANSTIYKATHDLTVSQGSGTYLQDEIVYQGTEDNPTFSGRVLNFDSTNNLLYLINTQGTVTLYQGIYGSVSNASRVLLQEFIEQMIPFSGNIIYIENRTKVQRTTSGLEQFRLTLNY